MYSVFFRKRGCNIMIDVGGFGLNNFCRVVNTTYKEKNKIMIKYDDFLEKSFTKQDLSNFPRTVFLPKSTEEMLETGGTSKDPSGKVPMKQPIRVNGKPTPYWSQTAKDGIKLTIGYRNGDSRFPEILNLNDDGVHALLVGSTGSGKSVTLDAILFSVLLNYPPWEVEVHLLDAKISTFLPYGKYNIPHVKSVGATEDTDYIISVLEHLVSEMNRRNSIFATVDANKLSSFEDRTNLTLPRVLIIVDEFQALFTNAGKKADRVKELFQLFAKLGRNTGYHLICCSQEPDGLPDTTMQNMTNRLALACGASVSEKVLGNPEASTLKSNYPKGRIIINRDPNAKNNQAGNVHVQVPYLDEDTKEYYIKMLKELGKALKWHNITNCYNENQVLREDDFKVKLRELPVEDGLFYLGEASYFTEDDDKMCKFKLKSEGADNISILAANEDITRNLLTMKYNMEMHPEYSNIVLYNSEESIKDCELNTLTKKMFRIRDCKDPKYIGTLNQVYLRRIMTEIDDMVFNETQYKPHEFGIRGAEKLLPLIKKQYPNYIETELNYTRLQALCELIARTEDYQKRFGLQIQPDKYSNKEVGFAYGLMLEYNNLHLADTKAVASKLPKLFVWILGLDGIKGIGSDQSYKDQEDLNRAMATGPELNVRFIFQMSKTDSVTKMKNYTRIIFGNNFEAREQNFFGLAEVYPKEVSPKQGVFFDATQSKNIYKYKKLYLKGETIV